MPSNEGRGYVLQTTAAPCRHVMGRQLGIEGTIHARTQSKTVIALSKDGYPELEEKQRHDS